MIRPRIPKRWCRFRIRISATVAGRWGSVGGGRVRSPRWLPALSSDGCRTISCQQLSSLATRGHRVLRQAMVEQGRLLYQQPRPTLMFDETRPPSFRPLFGKRAQPPGRPGLRRLDPSNVGDRARSRRRALGGPIGLLIGGPSWRAGSWHRFHTPPGHLVLSLAFFPAISQRGARQLLPK
jgi:hypothetical protein